MKRTTYFLSFHLVLGAVYFQPIRELAEFSWNHDYCTYIVLVPFVTAWLLFLKWKEVIAMGASGSRWGWALMVSGFVFYLAAIGLRGLLNQVPHLLLTVRIDRDRYSLLGHDCGIVGNRVVRLYLVRPPVAKR